MTLYNKITHRIILFLGIKSIKLIPIINNLCNNTLLYFTSGIIYKCIEIASKDNLYSTKFLGY